MLEISFARSSEPGELVLVSQLTRTQSRNIEDCIDKLYDLITRAAEIPKGQTKKN
ncbi:19688_t:CDS:2 [Entrophospora sp. SA101]|nr:19688_t:CDS:2 [Entrophospora sp. SA101]CAJ0825604.1 6486_t:CDS:2 [Entrophospora sp. SA101]CAJ0842339.1 15281_t:CDS:2 [Entrophospora sp. SA101]